MVAAPFLALSAACAGEVDLVVYVAHDQVHSEALIQRFENETGLRVRAEYDVEASKTIGLVNRIRAEAGRPRCDVFWNNEFAHMVALADEGILAPYDSPSAADIPQRFRDPGFHWTGFAARARVFIVNTEEASPAEVHGLDDLLDPRWARRVGMARPLTGTTLTHAAALFSAWGESDALAFLEGVALANKRGDLGLARGNGHLMRTVRDGNLAWGLTDTDDFNVARLAGAPVALVVPDQVGPDPRGTLLIPNTVGILATAPHPENARRFVDWLLSPGVEEELAHSRAAQIPVRAAVPRPDHVLDVDSIVLMDVDYVQVGRELAARHDLLKKMFVE